MPVSISFSNQDVRISMGNETFIGELSNEIMNTIIDTIEPVFSDTQIMQTAFARTLSPLPIFAPTIVASDPHQRIVRHEAVTSPVPDDTATGPSTS